MLNHIRSTSTEGGEVNPPFSQRHLVANGSLVEAIADEGVIFPEAYRAD
jgi:hypothetical protein